MRKIALITDTASDISMQLQQKYNVKVLHFQIVYGDKSYKDQIEITSKEVLDTIAEKAPTTSLPSLEEIHGVFEELKAEGYTHAIGITISSNLSGCYNALSMVKDEYPEIETYVYDSRTISIPECVLVERAGELIEEGKDIPEIIDELEKMRSKQHTFFLVDTLKYLAAGGRIGHVSAVVGGILNLKPIITVGDDGKYISHAKARGRNKALAVITEEAKKILAESKCKVYFIHGDGRESIDKLYDELKDEKNIETIEKWDWISPVACVHTGPGFIGALIQEIE